MPAPRWLARANRHGLNRVMPRLARHAPGFGVVIHRGRRSGRESEWVRNVLAASGCQLETRGRVLTIDQPRLFHDTSREAVPALVRGPLRLLSVADFLELAVVE